MLHDCGAKPPHQFNKIRKARRDRCGVVNAHGEAAAQSGAEEGHGDPVIETRLDQGAALERTADAFNGQIVSIDSDGGTTTLEAGSNSRQTIALFDAQLGKTAHHRAPTRARGGDGEDW